MAFLVRLIFVVALSGLLTAPAEKLRAQQAAPTVQQQLLRQDELDQLLSPIALYPDNLLSQVMIASTYPLEVIEADRWLTANKNLQGEALKAAVQKQSWDDSIKALTAVPTVLSNMSSKLEWTRKLGDAVLAQQIDVMDAVQRLRARADHEKQLASTKEQKVTKKTEGSKQVIVIEQTNPNVMYVPYYNPSTIYGAWPYPSYPPYVWPHPPGYWAGAAMWFGAGLAIGAAWGGSFNWGNNNININNDIDINRNKKWEHNVDHRKGVRYNNDQVRQKFSKDGAKVDNRKMDFRGKDGSQVLKPSTGSRDLSRDLAQGKGGLSQKGDARPGQVAGKGAGDLKGGKGAGGDLKGGKGGAGAAQRPSGSGDRGPSSGRGPGSNNAFSNVGNGNQVRQHSDRGRQSVGHHGGGRPQASRGGGGPRGGGGGGRGGRRPWRWAALVIAHAGSISRKVVANMTSGNKLRIRYLRCHFGLLALASFTLAILVAAAVPVKAQQSYPSPEDAVDALIGAVRARDLPKIIQVLGPAGQEIVYSGDPVADQNNRDDFVAAYDQGKKVEKDADKATLIVGSDDWPFPIPLKRYGKIWRFDTIAGRYEILYRRIGRNELSAIETCFAYVEAQYEYAEFAKREFGKAEYAQRIVSSPGKKDGLYWPATSERDDSPLGELFAYASDEGYSVGAAPIPYQGYYFKILKQQGYHAPGGYLNYIVKGKMTEGFALVAWPAEYGNSGVKTFLVNHLGVVYEGDLGRATPQIIRRMVHFNPQLSWKRYTENKSQ